MGWRREQTVNTVLVSKTGHSSACVNNVTLGLDDFNISKITELLVTCIIEPNFLVKMGLGLNLSSRG